MVAPRSIHEPALRVGREPMCPRPRRANPQSVTGTASGGGNWTSWKEETRSVDRRRPRPFGSDVRCASGYRGKGGRSEPPGSIIMMATSRRRRSVTPQVEALENIISLSTNTASATLSAYQTNSNTTSQSGSYNANANATNQANVAAIQQAQ